MEEDMQQVPSSRSRRNRVVIGGIIGGVALFGILVAIGSGGTPSSPSYVSKLTADGYTVQKQSAGAHGDITGWAYGQDSTGMSEAVVQFKTSSDATSVATLGDSEGLTVRSTGDLLVYGPDPSSYDVTSFISGLTTGK